MHSHPRVLSAYGMIAIDVVQLYGNPDRESYLHEGVPRNMKLIY